MRKKSLGWILTKGTLTSILKCKKDLLREQALYNNHCALVIKDINTANYLLKEAYFALEDNLNFSGYYQFEEEKESHANSCYEGEFIEVPREEKSPPEEKSRFSDIAKYAFRERSKPRLHDFFGNLLLKLPLFITMYPGEARKDPLVPVNDNLRIAKYLMDKIY